MRYRANQSSLPISMRMLAMSNESNALRNNLDFDIQYEQADS